MYLKIHQSRRNIVAICDPDLLGKKFEEGKKQLDVRENFYKGEFLAEEKIVNIMKKEKQNDSTFYIVGEKSVKLALENEIIFEGNIGHIAGIPFALVLI